MYAITAITRCTVLDIQTREKNFHAGIINILKNSRVQKYWRGRVVVELRVPLNLFGQYLSIMGKTSAQIHKNQTMNYKNPEI